MNVFSKRPLLLPAVLAVGLWVAGLVVGHALSDKIPHHPTDAQLLTWIKDNTNPILMGGWLWMLGCLAFLWFAVLLRARLAEAEGGAGTYATLAFAGAIATAVLGMLFAGGDVGAAIDKDSISAATAGMLHNGGDVFFVAAELMLIPFYVGTAVVALRTRALPKAWAFLSIVIAVVLAIGPIGWAATTFGTPVWLLGTGLLVGRGERVPRAAAAVVAAALGLLALFGATASPAGAASKPRTLTFHLLEKQLSFDVNDVAPLGATPGEVSPGDSFEFTSALVTPSGKRAGTIRVHCVFVTGGKSYTAASICQGTFGFAGGTLEAQATQRGEPRVSHIAILGGTGAYEGATGSVTSVGSEKGPTHDTFHVLLP